MLRSRTLTGPNYKRSAPAEPKFEAKVAPQSGRNALQRLLPANKAGHCGTVHQGILYNHRRLYKAIPARGNIGGAKIINPCGRAEQPSLNTHHRRNTKQRWRSVEERPLVTEHSLSHRTRMAHYFRASRGPSQRPQTALCLRQQLAFPPPHQHVLGFAGDDATNRQHVPWGATPFDLALPLRWMQERPGIENGPGTGASAPDIVDQGCCPVGCACR